MPDLVAQIAQHLTKMRSRINQVRYGDVQVTIQEGRIVRVKIAESWEPLKERAPPDKVAN